MSLHDDRRNVQHDGDKPLPEFAPSRARERAARGVSLTLCRDLGGLLLVLVIPGGWVWFAVGLVAGALLELCFPGFVVQVVNPVVDPVLMPVSLGVAGWALGRLFGWADGSFLVTVVLAGSAGSVGGTEGGDSRPLVTHAEFSATASQSHAANDDSEGSRAVRRFALQAAARYLMPGERVARCMRFKIPGRQGVELWHDPVHKAGHFGGLQTCGSATKCPVCAARVSERRRVELSEALKIVELASTPAQSVALATLTLSHHRGDDLRLVLDTLTDARNRLTSCRAWAELRSFYGLVGQVRALETTKGYNGWHPHLHILLFFDRKMFLPTRGVSFLEWELKRLWVHVVGLAGGSADLKHGCTVESANSKIADYVAKFGKEPAKKSSNWTAAHELAKAGSKGARRDGDTPMGLLARFAFEGDKEAGALWQIYARAIKHENSLRWSPGLRKLLGLGAEKSDQEIAKNPDEMAVLLGMLGWDEWRAVLAADARGQLADLVGTGDLAAVHDFIDSLVGVSLPAVG